MISRRKLLTGAGALAAAAALPGRPVWADGPVGESWAPYPSVATWGGPKKILEIFLYGGLSAWESFHVDLRDSLFKANLLSAFNSTALLTHCGSTQTGATVQTFGGMKWSVATSPLWSRPDLLARTRVVTMTHEFSAHPVAIPLALTGRPLGDARAASLGAAIKRRHPEQHTSYVLMPDSGRFFGGDDKAFSAWLSVGAHGSAARPVLVPMSSGVSEMADWASRTGVNAGADALTSYYADLYETNLDGSRSRGYGAYRAALDSLSGSPSLTSVFNSSLRGEGASLAHCSTNVVAPGTPLNTTAACLDMAAWLFNTKGTRYVGMVDVGIGKDTGAAYDGHGHTAGVTFGNLFLLLKELSRVTSTATPQANRISVDDTLIILNTEFGRTPDPDPQGIGGTGRDHYGRGYVVVLIGGPIQPTASGEPKLIGTMDWTAGPPAGRYTPANLACVALTAAGIDPHGTDNFAFQELPPGMPSSYEQPFFQA
ncbi:DUF1501 domain-containing protein [Sorangium sp. So ce381]|uniref:DUF1501 domain-containing protein n=1 Tax=Sorangium sp. So ce381 TaxID=3133307 RepID=UPI003F5B0FDB